MLPIKRIPDEWLPSIFNDFLGNDWFKKSASNMPAVNIKETPTDFGVELAAPGLTKDDFKISINEDHQLVISVQKDDKKEEKDDKGQYIRKEFSYSEFQQTLILPDNVETDKISAKVDNGILYIDIPKIEKTPTKAKNIDVK